MALHCLLNDCRAFSIVSLLAGPPPSGILAEAIAACDRAQWDEAFALFDKAAVKEATLALQHE